MSLEINLEKTKIMVIEMVEKQNKMRNGFMMNN